MPTITFPSSPRTTTYIKRYKHRLDECSPKVFSSHFRRSLMRYGAVLGLAVAFSSAQCVLAQSAPQVPDSAVVKKSITSVGYQVGAGATKVLLLGTQAAANANGEAKVEAKTAG